VFQHHETADGQKSTVGGGSPVLPVCRPCASPAIVDSPFFHDDDDEHRFPSLFFLVVILAILPLQLIHVWLHSIYVKFVPSHQDLKTVLDRIPSDLLQLRRHLTFIWILYNWMLRSHFTRSVSRSGVEGREWVGWLVGEERKVFWLKRTSYYGVKM
jgi:hypothetical protein